MRDTVTFENKGFTLVELSIVLVIIGLLTGAVFAGKNLIHAAELRNVAVESDEMIRAFRTFTEQYGGRPGDLHNAAQIWGAADGLSGNSAGCKTASPNTTATCNGDGDGEVEQNITSSEEFLRAWQHLKNAGLIKGDYTGIRPASGPSYVAGVNAPAASVPQGLYLIMLYSTLGSGHYLQMSQGNLTGVMSNVDMYNFDRKFDDGNQRSGNITGINDSTPSTFCEDDSTDSGYALQFGDSRMCMPLFRIDSFQN